MKNLMKALVAAMCIIFVLGLADRATAQDRKISKKDVPPAVISAFHKAYPNAKIKGYLIETEGGKTYYEIESVEQKTVDALVLPDGTIYEVEEGVAAKDLPDSVTAAVSAKYPEGKISRAEKTTRGAEVTYDLRVTSGKTKVSLSIDPSGKIVKESKRSAKKEGKEEIEEKEED